MIIVINKTMNKRNTVQKELIANIVELSCDHPTAEMVYYKAKEELPSISLGTVYRVLKELVADGRVVELCFAGMPSRYDKTLHAHAHLCCKNCGKIVDVEYDNSKFLLEVLYNSDTIIDEAHITLTGLCEDCKTQLYGKNRFGEKI